MRQCYCTRKTNRIGIRSSIPNTTPPQILSLLIRHDSAAPKMDRRKLRILNIGIYRFSQNDLGSFTINVHRTFRFLRFFTPSPLTLTRTKMSARKRYQNGSVRPFFENLKTSPHPGKMSARSLIKNSKQGQTLNIKRYSTVAI